VTGNERVSRVERLERELIDPIAEKLEGEAVIPYLEVKRSTRMALVNGLRGVQRWSTTPYKMDPEWSENNLEHVLGLLDWAGQMAREFPELKEEICGGNEEEWMNLLAMLIIHDIGEIAVGDICRSDPRFHKAHGRLHKRRESYAAHLMLGNEEMLNGNSAKLRGLYHRFDKRDSLDMPVMIGHMFDKGQATGNVAKHQVKFNLDNPDFNSAKSAKVNLGVSMDYMVKVMGKLSSTKRRQDLANFFSERVIRPFDELGLAEVDDLLKDTRRQFAQMCIIL